MSLNKESVTVNTHTYTSYLLILGRHIILLDYSIHQHAFRQQSKKYLKETTATVLSN